jgi:hypothetical protein
VEEEENGKRRVRKWKEKEDTTKKEEDMDIEREL